MSLKAISKNDRDSQTTLLRIKKIGESTNLSISEILDLADSELENIFQLTKPRKIKLKKNLNLSTYGVDKNGY